MDTQHPSIGVVTKIVGKVTLKSPDGQSHILNFGDIIHQNDKIITDENASISMIMTDGKMVDIGSDSSQKMGEVQGKVPADVIQNAVEQNVDPKQIVHAIETNTPINELLPMHVDHLFYVPWVTLGKVEAGFPTNHLPWSPGPHEDYLMFRVHHPQNALDEANGRMDESTIQVFEDARPFQYLGDYSTVISTQIPITFIPADNEQLLSITFNNIPIGATLQDNSGSIVGDGINSFTVDFSDLSSLVFIEPLLDSDHDLVLNYTALIQDPNSGLQNTINGAVNVIVDAVADKPRCVTGDVTNEEEHPAITGFAYSVSGKQTGGEQDQGTYLYKIDLFAQDPQSSIVAQYFMSSSHFNVEAMDLDPVASGGVNYLYALATTGNPNVRELIQIDPSNGNTVVFTGGNIPLGNLAGFAFDIDGKLYAAVVDGNSSDFFSITIDAGNQTVTTSTIGSIDVKLGGLAIDNDPSTDDLYGIGKNQGQTTLYSIDRSDGSIISSVDVTNIPNGADLECLDFDSLKNLWTIDRLSGNVYTIDVTTGIASLKSTTLGNGSLADNGFESIAIVPGESTKCVDAGHEADFTLAAKFRDFTDGSETHFFLIAIPDGWSAPDGTEKITVNSGDFDGLVTPGDYIKVIADGHIDGSGNASVDTSIITPTDITQDTPFSLQFYAIAQEVNFSGVEFDFTNNLSVTPGGDIDIIVCSPKVDLAIDKTVSDEAPNIFDTITYSLAVTNNTDVIAKSIVVTDQIPTGLNISNISNNGTFDAQTNTITWNLPDGFTGTLTYDAFITSSVALSDVLNTAHVTSITEDNNPANNTDKQTIDPKDADLSAAKSDGSESYTPGLETTYVITVHNSGANDVTDAVITDTIPSGFTIDQTLTTQGFVINGNEISWSNQAIASGADLIFTLVGTYGAGTTGSKENDVNVHSLTVFDPNLANNNAMDIDSSNPISDLSITKTDGHISYTPGTDNTYTIVVTNNGPSDVIGASFSDTLPNLFNESSISWSVVTSAGSFASIASGSGSYAITDSLNLLSGGTATFTVSGHVLSSATGDLVNTANISAPAGTTDPTPGNNMATDTDAIAQQIDLSITKINSTFLDNHSESNESADDPTPLSNFLAFHTLYDIGAIDTGVPGGDILYGIQVTNNGPSDAVNVEVKDIIPSGLSEIFWQGSDGSSGNGDIDQFISLASGDSIFYVVFADINSSATGQIINIATVAPPPGTIDTDPSNNSSTNITTLQPQADLSITKTDGHTTYTPGTDNTYTIVVTNNGPSDVTAASFSDTLPNLFNESSISWSVVTSAGSFASISGGSGSYSIVDSLNILSGGTATFTVSGHVLSSAAGDLVNTANITAPAGTTDSIPGNNMATDTDTINRVADLSITKTDGHATYTPGTDDTYTIIVTNNGPSDVTGANFSDTLPNLFNQASISWSVVTSAGSSASIASGSGSYSIIDSLNLLSGGTATFTVSGHVLSSAAGDLVNTANIAAPAGTTDPTDGNNMATDTDTIAKQADLSITKTDGHATYTPGTDDTYTIIVTNNGPSDVTAASFSDTLPNLFNQASISWSVVTSAGSSASIASGSGSYSIVDSLNLLSGGTATFTVSGHVLSSATGDLVNTANIAAPAGTTDPTAGNNMATDTDTANPLYDLSILKTVADFSSNASQEIVTYTITVNNSGPSIASNFNVTDAFLPADLLSANIATLTLVSETQGSFNTTSGAWSGLTLDSGSTATLIFKATINADPAGSHDNLGDIRNTVTITNATNDTNAANNTSTANIFHECVWMPDAANVPSTDPVQNQLLGNFVNGYGLNIESNITPSINTQIASGELSVKVLTLPTEGTIGYMVGNTFTIVHVGDTLSNSVFNSLLYKPAADGSASDSDFGQFKYGLYDSGNHQTALGIVDLNTVPPVQPFDFESVTIGDRSHPLTSGQDISTTITITQAEINNITDFSNGNITLHTDFQKAPFDQPIPSGEQTDALNHLHSEVSVTLKVEGVDFNIVSQTSNDPWTIDSNAGIDNGIWQLTVDFNNITEVNNPSISLSTFLATSGNTPNAGDTWTITYDDHDGGSYQARFIETQFAFNVNARPDVVIEGCLNQPNVLYGGTGNDKIIGGYFNDLIEGRQGSDTLSGNGGNDTYLFHGVSTNGGDINLSHLDTTHITDFTNANPASDTNGDVLELDQVFTDLANFGSGNNLTNISTLDKYISINGSGSGSSAQTNINISSTANGAVVHTFHLDGVNLGTGDAAISNMINQQTLVVHA